MSTNSTKYTIHLVSDSSGETVQKITKACLAQFPQNNFTLYNHILVKNIYKLEKVIEKITSKPGLIFYSLADKNINNNLNRFIHKNKLSAVDILEKPIYLISKEVLKSPTGIIGGQHTMDYAYFNRINAMQYSQRNDDGQNIEDFKNAEILILGVSRCSKTPTCMYLANKGYFVANLPIIYEIPIDKRIIDLAKKKSVFVVGLYMDVKQLSLIRKNRNLGLINSRKNYYNHEYIIKEIAYSRRIYNELDIMAINVTSKSIEETAAEIISRLERKRMNK